jgi:glycosyltransferase involved in cell wall biosynthesis
MMKALVISPQPFFSYRGTPLSVYYRTLMMAELGVQVDLLTYGEGQNVDIPGVRIIRIPRFKLLGNVSIGPSRLKLFLDIFITLWTIGLLIKNQGKNRYQFVHTHEEAVFIGCLLKPIFRFKLIYDMHSSLPEQLINFKFTTSKFLINFFKRLEAASLHASDAIITVCPSLFDYAERIVRSPERVALIENSIFEEIQVAGKRDRLPVFHQHWHQKRWIVYAGTLEPYQGIDILIHAFQRLLVADQHLMLMIVGGTPAQVKQYAELAVQLGLEQHCHFTGRVSPNEARYYSSRAAVQISCRVSGTNVPLKIYELLASGIPIVATNIPAHTQILTDEIAFMVNPNAKDMAQGIQAALATNGEGQYRAANAQQFYNRHYARRFYKDRLQQVLDNLNLPRSARASSLARLMRITSHSR